ncbi:hypothetical protein ILYODFUR_012883 [Ilyodon furcidens]|uniref:Uncharacterized protein n=1 Tax=Ilyodon furcidens TaxID=33524 RepID=A0ABV0U7Q1_9TELE
MLNKVSKKPKKSSQDLQQAHAMVDMKVRVGKISKSRHACNFHVRFQKLEEDADVFQREHIHAWNQIHFIPTAIMELEVSWFGDAFAAGSHQLRSKKLKVLGQVKAQILSSLRCCRVT